MKKLLSLLVALLVAMNCAAFAEPSTAMYVSVMDPIVYYNGEPILDMTGLNVDLGALVSDIGTFAVQALVNVGETYETSALAAQAQLDANGLTFSLDGMANAYSVDLSQFTNGFDVTTFLPMIPAHTFLNTPFEMKSYSVDLSLPVRYAACAGLMAEYIAEDGSIAIDKTQGELLINQLLTMLETAADSLSIDGIAEIRAQKIAFDLTGALTVEGDPASGSGSYAITGSGNLYDNSMETGIPFELTFADSAEETNFSVDMHQDEDSAAFVLGNTYTTAADGRKGFECSGVIMVNDVEEVLMGVSVMPVEESRQMDYMFTMQVPDAQVDTAIILSTGTNGENLGFGLDVFANTEGDSVGLYLYYEGEKIVDEYGVALNGMVAAGVEYNEESYGFDTYLLLQKTNTDTSVWAYDSTGAIALETMDETQSSAMQMGLMGVAGTAVGAVMENVPGLAPIISSMMG